MSLFNLFLVLALTINVLCEPIPKLNQRFSAAFKISHPLAGNLGQGVVCLTFLVHAVDPTDFGNVTALIVPARNDPTKFVSSVYHHEKRECKKTEPAPISTLPPFQLPPSSTYVSEQKVNGVKCGLWEIASLPAPLADYTFRVSVSQVDKTVRRIEISKKGIVPVVAEFTKYDIGPIPASQWEEIPACRPNNAVRDPSFDQENIAFDHFTNLLNFFAVKVERS